MRQVASPERELHQVHFGEHHSESRLICEHQSMQEQVENSKVPSVSQMLWLEPVAIDIQHLILATLGVELTRHSTER